MPTDPGYAVTRRRGSRGTITRTTGPATFNAETGDITPSTTVTSVRWVVKEPTKYSRFVRAEATKQDVGETTFIMWAKDPDLAGIDRLDPEDKITFDGLDYQVRTSTIEDKTAFVVTADQIEGSQ